MDFGVGPLDLAPQLLGAQLTWRGVTVKITEVEAYAGSEDPAAHAYRGWRPHVRHLFEAPGTLYCYRSHGLHLCANVVSGPSSSGSAVLLRAGEVVAGRSLAHGRRGDVSDHRLARGPGCLGQALGLTLEDSGRRVGEQGLVLAAPEAPPTQVSSGPRVGVSVAHERPWRFWIEGDPTVSAYRRSPRIRPGVAAW